MFNKQKDGIIQIKMNQREMHSKLWISANSLVGAKWYKNLVCLTLKNQFLHPGFYWHSHSFSVSISRNQRDHCAVCIQMCNFSSLHSVPLCAWFGHSDSCHGWHWGWCSEWDSHQRRGAIGSSPQGEWPFIHHKMGMAEWLDHSTWGSWEFNLDTCSGFVHSPISIDFEVIVTFFMLLNHQKS